MNVVQSERPITGKMIAEAAQSTSTNSDEGIENF